MSEQYQRTKYHQYTITTEQANPFHITILSPTGDQLYYGPSRQNAISHAEATAEAKDMIDNIESR